MQKFLPKLHFIFSLASALMSNLILLFAGTIYYDYTRMYGCYGTGCYGAGNGTGSGGYSRLSFTMLSGMGVDDDALVLSILLFVMIIMSFVLFFVMLSKKLKKKELNLKNQIIYYSIFGFILLTFSIWDAINASNSDGPGGDVIAVFSFLWLFSIIGLIILDGITISENRKKVAE